MIEEHTPNLSSIPTQCKFCGSRRLVRYGRYNLVQRWFCKECRRKFVDNHAPPGLRTPAVQISSALSMFYEGMSLNTIRRHLEQAFHNLPSDSTVYEWVVKYTKVAALADADRRAHTKKITQELGHGPFWIANDTPLNIQKTDIWIWDVVDYGSRILVDSVITTTRTSNDFKKVMEITTERVGELPGLVITGRDSIYQKGIEQTFGSDALHLQATSPKVQPYSNTIARYHGPMKTRNNILRGLKRLQMAELFLEGWLVHYNFFRTHEALKYSTPASVAKIDFPYKNWLDIVNKGTVFQIDRQ
jgi:transposase-like protein